MKSILKDVSRLKKAYVIFERLVLRANELNEQLSGHGFPEYAYPVLLGFKHILLTANAFNEKYGGNK